MKTTKDYIKDIGLIKIKAFFNRAKLDLIKLDRLQEDADNSLELAEKYYKQLLNAATWYRKVLVAAKKHGKTEEFKEKFSKHLYLSKLTSAGVDEGLDKMDLLIDRLEKIYGDVQDQIKEALGEDEESLEAAREEEDLDELFAEEDEGDNRQERVTEVAAGPVLSRDERRERLRKTAPGVVRKLPKNATAQHLMNQKLVVT